MVLPFLPINGGWELGLHDGLSSYHPHEFFFYFLSIPFQKSFRDSSVVHSGLKKKKTRNSSCQSHRRHRPADDRLFRQAIDRHVDHATNPSVNNRQGFLVEKMIIGVRITSTVSNLEKCPITVWVKSRDQCVCGKRS